MRVLAAVSILLGWLFSLSLAHADTVHLRDGRVLVGDVLEESDDQTLVLRLHATGGVVRIPWKNLASDCAAELRKLEDPEPTVSAHRVVFRSGKAIEGLVLNPDGEGLFIELRTADGISKYPRKEVSSIEPRVIRALDIYAPEELARKYEEEASPMTPEGHLALAERCLRVEAYRAAKKHYETALAGLEDDGKRAEVEKTLSRVRIFLKADKALEGVRRIRKLIFQKRFDEALGELTTLRKTHAAEPAIRKLLRLDRLEKEIGEKRRAHRLADVERRFFSTLDRIVRAKVTEKNVVPADVLVWAVEPEGLAKAIFTALAEDVGIGVGEARELFASRASRQVRRYPYPYESSAALVDADAWWRRATRKERESFVKARFAELGEVLTLLRVEARASPRERIVIVR